MLVLLNSINKIETTLDNYNGLVFFSSSEYIYSISKHLDETLSNFMLKIHAVPTTGFMCYQMSCGHFFL